MDGSEELYNLEIDPEEWDNLAYDKEYKKIVTDLRNDIPKHPVNIPEESLLELSEHHIPPVISREYYFSLERKNWLKRFKE